MKKMFFGFLIAGSLVFLFISASPIQQGSLPKAGEDTGISNKALYKPYVKQAINASLVDPAVLSALAPEELMQVQLAGYDTSLKYRGVLAVNVDSEPREELIVDFGALGVYLYDPFRSPVWTQLDSRDPDIMIAADRDGDGIMEIICSWGSGNGADFWSDGTGWTAFQNTGWYDVAYYSADVDGNGDDEIVVISQNVSTYQYDLYVAGMGASTWPNTWKKAINNYFSLGAACQFAAPDDELVHAYNGMKWWNYVSGDSDYTDNWASMTGAGPDIFDSVSANLDGDGEEEFCTDVLGGLWIYDYSNATKWTRAVNYQVYDIRKWECTIGSSEELLASFAETPGLWMYRPGLSPKWLRLNGLTPEWDQGFLEVFNPDGDGYEDLAVDFGATGLWRLNSMAYPMWTPLNGNDPYYMVRADLDNDGDDELLVRFESLAGLWKWDDDTTPKWIRINGATPE